jgi:hypothetical protein
VSEQKEKFSGYLMGPKSAAGFKVEHRGQRP